MKTERLGVRTLVFVLCLLSAPLCLKGIAEDPKIDLSRFFKDVVKTITGQNRPRPRVVPAQPVLPVPEDESKRRQDRLEAYMRAASYWVSDICGLTAEQSAQLKDFTVAHLEASQENYAKANNAQQMQKPLTDFAPIRFTGRSGAGFLATGYDWKETLKTLLNRQQYEKLQKARLARSRFHRYSQAGHLINLVDDELFITVEKRKQLQDVLALQFKDDWSKFYSLHSQSYFFDYESVHTILQQIPDDILNEFQRARLNDIVKSRHHYGPDSEHIISFMSNGRINGSQFMFDEVIVEQRKRLERAADVRVSHFVDVFDLSHEDQQRLMIAAKGAVLYVLQEWKTSANIELQQWNERAANKPNVIDECRIRAPKAIEIDSNRIWSEAVKACCSSMANNNGRTPRAHAHHQADIDYIVSFLDRELWLTETQRVELTQLVIHNVRNAETDEKHYYVHEIVQIAIPLAIISKKDLRGILDESQMDAWSALKSQFQFNGRQATFTMRNMGQFSFSIPQQAAELSPPETVPERDQGR